MNVIKSVASRLDSGNPGMGEFDPRLRLSEAQWRLLGEGFRGPRPGSNALALLGLSDGDVTITGEQIDMLLKAGFLTVRHVHGAVEVLPASAGPYGEVPEVEMTHNYRLSAAGRRVRTLAETE
jgi:hypothetical protein